MNPFLLSPTERLSDWKAVRSSLADMTDEQAIAAVAKYWAQAPVCRMAYDYDEMEKWPTAWEMISANEWCRDSIAYGMEFTLRLGGFSPERLRLILIRDYDISDQMIVLEIDRTIFLNYDVGEITPLPKTRWAAMAVWEFSGRGMKRD